MSGCSSWKGFRNYQRLAHHVITLKDHRDIENDSFYGLMRDELDEMLEDIVMHGDAIQEAHVAWNNCDETKIAMKLQAAPTPNSGTKIILVIFSPDWIGVKFARPYPKSFMPITQLKKWLMTEVN